VLRGGRPRTLRLPVARATEDPPRNLRKLSGIHPLSGASVANLSPAVAEELNFDTVSRGVVIMAVRRGSTAHRLNFRRGDIMLAINGREPSSVATLSRTLAREVGRWRMSIWRDGRTISVVFGS